MALKYSLSILGGTFDRFHSGHQLLLDTAFRQSEKVIIGVSTAALHKQKVSSHLIEGFLNRHKYIQDYLKKNNLEERAAIIPIDDIYGNSLTEKGIQAIFATEDNIANVSKINEERVTRGFVPLAVVTVPYKIGNDGKIITSGRIRLGEIDREGNAYSLLFEPQARYTLPQSLRETVRKPVGELFEDIEAIAPLRTIATMTIAIGDIVALSLIRNNSQADVSVVDLKTQRNKLSESDITELQSLPQSLQVRNQRGSIEKQAVTVLQTAMTKSADHKQIIFVTGEEDLLAIPAILLAPLQSIIVYGQYKRGVVAVIVTEEKKKDIADIFMQFV